MITAHFNAVKARLEAHPQLSGKVYDSARVGTSGLIRDNYVILFGNGPDVLDDDRLAATQQADSDAEFLYPIRAIGTTTTAVRLLSEAVAAQLIGRTLTIPNRVASPIELDDSGPLEIDDSVSPPLFYADSDYILRTSRA